MMMLFFADHISLTGYVKHDKLYYGYPTAENKCPTKDCVDDMFIIIGKTIARRLVKRPLCKLIKRRKISRNCLKTSEMVMKCINQFSPGRRSNHFTMKDSRFD